MHRDSAIVLLYGPPAVGKDTVTGELSKRDPRYRLFPRLKCGPGRTESYRMISAKELIEIRSIPDEVVWENERYSATYIVDRSHLNEMLAEDLVPVVHVGQADAVPSIKTAFSHVRALVVSLVCDRETALSRLRARGTTDVDERLTAYDETPQLLTADLVIDTASMSPDQAAFRIDAVLQ